MHLRVSVHICWCDRGEGFAKAVVLMETYADLARIRWVIHVVHPMLGFQILLLRRIRRSLCVTSGTTAH